MNRHLYHYHELDGADSELSRHSVKSKNYYGGNVVNLDNLYNVIDQRLSDYLTESYTGDHTRTIYKKHQTNIFAE